MLSPIDITRAGVNLLEVVPLKFSPTSKPFLAVILKRFSPLAYIRADEIPNASVSALFKL